MYTPMPLPFEPQEPPTESRQVTPRQLLGIRESEWRPRLESVSLVSEVRLKQKELDQAALALGKIFSDQLDVYQRSSLHHWPACTAAVTVGTAVTRYSGGLFWSALWKTARVPKARQNATSWGTDVLRSLELLGLDPFPEMTQRYVGPILMHSGIPTYCLDDFFDLLLQRSARTPGLDAHELHQWAVSRQHRLDDLDMPAQRFVLTGGDYALETIERCMHLLDLLREDPSARTSDVGLPPRFHRPALEALARAEAGGNLPALRAPSAQRPRTVRPKLRLDPYVHGVHIVLPSLDDGADVRWEVTTDVDTRTVLTRGRWGAGAGEQTVYALPHPTRAVNVSPQGSGVREQLDLITPEDPLVAFDDAGDLVNTDLALPPGPLWVMHPHQQELLRSGGVEQIGAADVPYGWEGWNLLRLRLHRGDWLQLHESPRHRVQGRERPQLETADPVPGLATPNGAPVLSVLPTVLLPGAEGDAVDWQVEIRSSEEGRLLTRVPGRSGERVDAFGQLPSPVVGSYTVHVRGPLGRGLLRQITVAEGIDPQHDPPVRALNAHGLVPAESRLACAEGTSAEPAHLVFSPGEPAHPAVLRTPASVLPLTVEPPHLRLLVTGEHAPQWRAEPLRLDCETLSEQGDLLLRTPDTHPAPGILYVLHGDEVVQEVAPQASSGSSTHRYRLSRIVETATRFGHLRLVVRGGDAVVPIARIRPRMLASEAEVRGTRIELEGFARMSHVNAAVYSFGAPWRAPVVLPVTEEGSIELPEALREAGPLRLLLAVEDPWSVTTWPRWPDLRDPNVLDCGAPGRPTGIGSEEEVCAAFADGGDWESLDLSGENAVRLWRVLGMSRPLLRAGMDIALIAACAEALGRHPLPALLAHGDAELSAEESVWSLVFGGLVAAPTGGRVPAHRTAELWHRLPAAAALATSDLMPLIDPSSADPEHTELLEQLERRCGPIAAELLQGSPDPAAGSGLFDNNTEFLAQMSEEQFEATWQAARVVPRGLLDQDSRTRAALGLFSVRHRPEMHRVRAAAPNIAATVIHLVKRLGPVYRDPLLALLEPRHFPNAAPWRNLPAASLAMALAARLAARGVRSFGSLTRAHHEPWSDLARSAPDLVHVDIVLAELALSGAERFHLAKEHTR